jgi:dTMP kinase
MLYSINRLEHKQEIEDWLSSGKVLVINRYCESNIAYGAASGVSIEWLRLLESKVPQADYIFYLRATTKLSKERKSERDKFEGDLSFLARVSSVYDALATDNPNWFTIDADDTVENIQYEIRRITEELVLKDRGKSETSINMRFRNVPPTTTR